MSHRFASKTVSPWTHPFQHFLRVASGRPHPLKHMVCRQHATYDKHRPKDVNVVQFKIMCPASSCVLYSRPADGWEAVRPWNSCTQSRTSASQGNRAIVHQLPGNTQLKMAVNFPVMNFSFTDAPVTMSTLYTGVFIHLRGFLVTDLTVKASGCFRKWC